MSLYPLVLKSIIHTPVISYYNGIFAQVANLSQRNEESSEWTHTFIMLNTPGNAGL